MILLSSTLLWGQSVEDIERYPSHSDTVFVLSKELLRKAEAESDTLRSAQAHLTLGRHFFEGGSFERAVDEYLLAERLIDQTSALEWRGKIKAHIGTAFHYASDTVSSLSHRCLTLKKRFPFTNPSTTRAALPTCAAVWVTIMRKEKTTIVQKIIRKRHSVFTRHRATHLA
ncbi:MAG: hypothetical protein LC664_06155 [Flavobacteriales bacterium]|nr:hypothetical protein [Flavobacteriales bacterium]